MAPARFARQAVGMQLALTTPVGKLALVGAAVLALGAVRVATQDHPVTYRLALHAPVRADAVYLTAWHQGPITLTFADGELRPVTLRTRGHLFGCDVQGTETLVPAGDGTFAYDYSEQLLGCEPNAVLPIKTPRQGVVTVSPR